jgi:hypothetical protein
MMTRTALGVRHNLPSAGNKSSVRGPERHLCAPARGGRQTGSHRGSAASRYWLLRPRAAAPFGRSHLWGTRSEGCGTGHRPGRLRSRLGCPDGRQRGTHSRRDTPRLGRRCSCGAETTPSVADRRRPNSFVERDVCGLTWNGAKPNSVRDGSRRLSKRCSPSRLDRLLAASKPPTQMKRPVRWAVRVDWPVFESLAAAQHRPGALKAAKSIAGSGPHT